MTLRKENILSGCPSGSFFKLVDWKKTNDVEEFLERIFPIFVVVVVFLFIVRVYFTSDDV